MLMKFVRHMACDGAAQFHGGGGGADRGNSLTFRMGCSCQSNFLDLQIIRLTFSKTPDNQLPTPNSD